MKKQLLLSALIIFICHPFIMEAQNPVWECDYNSGSWISKSPLPEGRAMMASNVIDGKIYLTGGFYDYGIDTFVFKHTLFIYDPLADSWDTTGTPIPYTRDISNSGQSVVDGKWYLVGGIDWEERYTGGSWLAVPVARVDAYDPQTDSWELKANLPEPMGGNGICTLDDKIYITGGVSGRLGSEKIYKSVYMYDPSKDTWTSKADMNYARYAHVSLAFNGKIYVFGGGSVDWGTNTQTVEVYDPIQDQWTDLSPECPPLSMAGGCVVDSAIYLFGGISDYNATNRGSKRITKYYPGKDEWKFYGYMPETNLQHSVCEIGGNIYIIGGRGYNFGVRNNVDEFKLSDLVCEDVIPDTTLSTGETISLDLSKHFSHLEGESISYTACTGTHSIVKDSIDVHMLMLSGMGSGTLEVLVRAESETDESGDVFKVQVTGPGVFVNDPSMTLYQIFPNPAGKLLTVQLQKEGTHDYLIYSASGQQVLEGILTGSSQTIDLSLLDKGMYFIKVCSPEIAVTRKFLKIW